MGVAPPRFDSKYAANIPVCRVRRNIDAGKWPITPKIGAAVRFLDIAAPI
jgi:hypothetical protein